MDTFVASRPSTRHKAGEKNEQRKKKAKSNKKLKKRSSHLCFIAHTDQEECDVIG